MGAEKYISEIDTNRFGFKIAKINSFDKKPELILNELRELGVKLIFSKINAKEISLINELESLGFRLKDGQLKYKFDLKKQSVLSLPKLSDEIEIREFISGDEDQVLEILSESFQGYGHYFADDKLSKLDSLEVYKDWGIKSCLDKRVADKVFIAEVDNCVAGILAFKIRQEEGYYAESTLGAVSSKYRGLSVFKQLAIKGLNWGVQERFHWEEHNVLVTNFPVNSSFSSLGFKVKDSFYTLHCWL